MSYTRFETLQELLDSLIYETGEIIVKTDTDTLVVELTDDDWDK